MQRRETETSVLLPWPLRACAPVATGQRDSEGFQSPAGSQAGTVSVRRAPHSRAHARPQPQRRAARGSISSSPLDLRTQPRPPPSLQTLANAAEGSPPSSSLLCPLPGSSFSSFCYSSSSSYSFSSAWSSSSLPYPSSCLAFCPALSSFGSKKEKTPTGWGGQRLGRGPRTKRQSLAGREVMLSAVLKLGICLVILEPRHPIWLS